MEWVKLGEIASLITKGTTPTTLGFDFVDEGINFIKIESISEEGSFISNKFNHITSECDNKLSRSRLQKNDLLFSIAGAIGRTAIVTDDILPANTNQALALIRIPEGVINYSYLKYVLQSSVVSDQFENRKQGVAQLNISLKDVANFNIPLPSQAAQQMIVEILGGVEVIISLRKQQLAKLDELVKSRFVELFGDKRYPEDTLLNLCNIIDYRGKTPEKVESGLPFITAKNVRMHQMNLEPREYISKETYDKVMVRGFPREGDVVFTTEAPLGNVCRIPHFDTEFYIGQRIVTMQTEKLEPIYLEYALSSDDFKTKYMGKSSGSTVTGIRVRLLEQLTIPVPPRELQNRFAAFVEQTDKSKLAVQQSIDQLETLKKSLMQKYFG